jgi:IS5 family transposase
MATVGADACVWIFELFRADLNAALGRSERRRVPGVATRPVRCFKILILQALYGFPTSRSSFRSRIACSAGKNGAPPPFFWSGLTSCASWGRSGGTGPDYSSVCGSEALVEATPLRPSSPGHSVLRKRGYHGDGGQLLDASVIEAQKQRMTAAKRRIPSRAVAPALAAARSSGTK